MSKIKATYNGHFTHSDRVFASITVEGTESEKIIPVYGNDENGLKPSEISQNYDFYDQDGSRRQLVVNPDGSGGFKKID